MSQTLTPEDQIRFLQTLFDEYQALSNGDKATIRRCVEPDDLLITPSFLRLIRETLANFKDPELVNVRTFFSDLSRSARVVYLLPFIDHRPQGNSLGAAFSKQKISERRLFIVMRSEYPQDLIQLRRLCQQIKDEPLDALKLSKQVFNWGKEKNHSEFSKRQLLKDFYLSTPTEQME